MVGETDEANGNREVVITIMMIRHLEEIPKDDEYTAFLGVIDGDYRGTIRRIQILPFGWIWIHFEACYAKKPTFECSS